MTLPEAFPGEERGNDFGAYYVCHPAVNQSIAARGAMVLKLRQAFDAVDGEGRRAHADLFPLPSVAVEDLLFLDLETAGLTAAPLFLVGTLRVDGDAMVVEQFLARDYAEEVALLWDFGQIAGQTPALVTFNGRTFDVPYLRDRMTYYHLPWTEAFSHLDLLTHARRRWKGRFRDCRLQTLEEELCGRRRIDDCPGERIPEQYHEFVRTQDVSLLAPLLHHNWLDLVTMVQVLTEVLQRCEQATRSGGTGASA
jgi:uncharacterized protein YprB with RNaseH-like and TPR domain